MQKKSATLSQRAYAKRSGLSQPYVNRLVKRGLIQIDEHGRIDPEEADRRRAENIVPHMRTTPDGVSTSDMLVDIRRLASLDDAELAQQFGKWLTHTGVGRDVR
jgi:hypothetical protein